jgi:hypothetical protein
MVSAGVAICATLERTLFKQLLLANTHKFGGVMPPVPQMEFKTAGDEVKTDQQDLVDQSRAEGRTPNIQTRPAQMSVNAKDAIEVVSSVASGKIPRTSAVLMLSTAFGMSRADADEMMGEAGRVVMLSSEAGHDGATPKARRRSKRQPTTTTQTTATLPTTSRLTGSLAKALRGK